MSTAGAGPIRELKSTWLRYSLAIVASLAALGFRWLLDPWLGNSLPLTLLVVAVVFSAWYCGCWPAILAALLTAAAGIYWFMPPRAAFSGHLTPELVSGLVYLLVSGFIIAFAESAQQNLKRLDQANRALHEAEERLQQTLSGMRDSHESLESQVQQRTVALQHLSASLLRLQDEERRRIARELHDSTGQTLTALKMNVAALRGMAEASGQALPQDLVREIENLSDQALKEIRTTSYLLHPPLLDEAGFSSAARWFIDGFSTRSNIQVDLQLPPGLERLPSSIELALFRVLQESLNNVHRYSGSTRADVTLELGHSSLSLIIRDYGRGIPPEVVDSISSGSSDLGVGLAGMRERISELGGELTVRSDGGTWIQVALPLPLQSNRSSSDNWSLGAVS